MVVLWTVKRGPWHVLAALHRALCSVQVTARAGMTMAWLQLPALDALWAGGVLLRWPAKTFIGYRSVAHLGSHVSSRVLNYVYFPKLHEAANKTPVQPREPVTEREANNNPEIGATSTSHPHAGCNNNRLMRADSTA